MRSQQGVCFLNNVLWPSALLSTFGIYRTCTYTAVMTSEQYTLCHSLGAELSIESVVVVNGGFLSSRFPSEVRRCIVLTEKPYKTVQCCKTPFQHF